MDAHVWRRVGICEVPRLVQKYIACERIYDAHESLFLGEIQPLTIDAGENTVCRYLRAGTLRNDPGRCPTACSQDLRRSDNPQFVLAAPRHENL